MRRIVALVVGLLLAGCSVISVDLSPRIRPLEEETVEGRGDAKVLLMDVSGFLSDEAPSGTLTIGSPPARVPLLVRLREELKKAAGDPKVRAVVVRINSPGGTVTASDVIFRELDSFKRARGVPIVASMMDVAASGGYYVALAADTIVAHPTTVTGSIGVILISLNAEGLTILFIEQNVQLALSIASRGYVLESGRTVIDGRSAELLRSPDVRRIFLGG